MNELRNDKCINFLKNGGSLLVIIDNKIIFESKDNYLKPLIECVKSLGNKMNGAFAYDKI